MIPLTIKPVSQQSQPDNSKISIDMAEQIADRAAHRAADETATRLTQENRENMESFNRFKEKSVEIPNEKDSIYESEGGYSIDTKTEKNLMRRLLDQTLQKALDPPPASPIENAVTQVMTQVSTGIAEKMLGNIGGGGQAGAKSGLLIDVLNSKFGEGLGGNLGANLHNIIQSLTSSIGQQKAQELASAATKVMSQQQNVESGNDNSSNAEKQKNMVLDLDINNIDHVKQYASAMGLSEKAAKGMLQIHQDDILSDRKNQFTNLNSSNNGSNNEITQALTILIQEMTSMKQTINALQNKIGGIDDNREISTEEIQQKSVTLFQSPIKVDLDEIKGNSDPFFNETPKDIKIEKQKESVLEEIVDSAGKSSFKMSDEKEQPKIEKIITEKKIEKPIEKFVEKEEDKKKENSVKLDELEKVEPESIEKSSQTEEILQSEEKPHQRKLIRKPIPIKKDTLDLPSHVTEHYDIDNKLIPEDKII